MSEADRRSRILRTGGVAAILAGVAGVLWWTWATIVVADEDEGSGGRPPATVTSGTARGESWSLEIASVGTVTAVQGVSVTSPAAGLVERIVFEPGSRVRRGDALVTLDTSTESAALAALEVRTEQARADSMRLRGLTEQGAVADVDLERATTELQRLEAELSEQRAVIDKKRITAPFDGELGMRQVSIGELVSPGTVIVSLSQISPIDVEFTIPEQFFGRLVPGQRVRASFGAYPESTFEGEVVTVSTGIDAVTRSAVLRARFDNSDGRLRPGMFAELALELGQSRDVVTVPLRALSYNAYGEALWRIEEPETGGEGESDAGGDRGGEGRTAYPVVERVFVRPGERRDGRVEIVEGLEPGARVVTAGQIKLGDGDPVEIVDALDRPGDGRVASER